MIMVSDPLKTGSKTRTRRLMDASDGTLELSGPGTLRVLALVGIRSARPHAHVVHIERRKLLLQNKSKMGTFIVKKLQ